MLCTSHLCGHISLYEERGDQYSNGGTNLARYKSHKHKIDFALAPLQCSAATRKNASALPVSRSATTIKGSGDAESQCSAQVLGRNPQERECPSSAPVLGRISHVSVFFVISTLIHHLRRRPSTLHLPQLDDRLPSAFNLYPNRRASTTTSAFNLHPNRRSLLASPIDELRPPLQPSTYTPTDGLFWLLQSTKMVVYGPVVVLVSVLRFAGLGYEVYEICGVNASADLQDCLDKKKVQSAIMMESSSKARKRMSELEQKLYLANKERIELEQEYRHRQNNAVKMGKRIKLLEQQISDTSEQQIKDTEAEEDEMANKLKDLQEEIDVVDSDFQRFCLFQVTAFGGHKVTSLLKAIERNHHKFKKHPIGPLGAHFDGVSVTELCYGISVTELCYGISVMELGSGEFFYGFSLW
ncbi:hypothetical protein LXL04_011352 [Taraxacum kok-saghyz]